MAIATGSEPSPPLLDPSVRDRPLPRSGVAAGAEPLAKLLDALTTEGCLYEAAGESRVRCVACGHRCLIQDGLRGVCKVRYNVGGVLRVPFGYVGAIHCDATEKKPFFHVLPGSRAMTFGMLGCDFHCSYCQNWLTSQTLRDPDSQIRPQLWTAEGLVRAACESGASLMVSSYNEPLITSEWAHAVFSLARSEGMRCAFVSNGNATREVLEYLRPVTDAYKIDLKSMRASNYRQLGGTLSHVLDTIQAAWELGFWVEIVTLLVPGWNTSDEELTEAARFIHSVSPDIPWHVTAFHRDYRMQTPENATGALLRRAARIGNEAGLRYVYAGNLPGSVDPYEDTYCGHCGSAVIRRTGFTVHANRVCSSGNCADCGENIPGIFN